MVSGRSVWSSVLMGALAVTTVACAGNIEEQSSGFEEMDRLAQSQDNLLRAIDPAKELMITDLSVVQSPEHTTFDPSHPSGFSIKGAWSFGRLIHNMLPAGSRDSSAAASAYTMNWLRSWEADQAPNTFVTISHHRSTVRARVITPWKKASLCAYSETDALADQATDAACTLDMGKAPFKLVAIVNRPDLRKLPTAGDPGFGGEGRFIFNLVVDGKPVKETVIFEYSLPIYSKLGTLTWAYRFHLLGGLPFGELYNDLLALVTNGFAGPGVDPRRPNGNALNQLRTNELALQHQAGCHPDGTFITDPKSTSFGLCKAADSASKVWELREFQITNAGQLAQLPVAQEPSRDFDMAVRTSTVDGHPATLGTGARSKELADWMMANQAALLAGTHKIPAAMLANSAYVGSGAPQWGSHLEPNPADPTKSITVVSFETSTGVTVPEPVRQAMALNTCGGCHNKEVSPVTGSLPTKTFLHVTHPAAFDPAENNDREAIIAGAGSEKAVLSDFVQKEIAPGGPRYNDFAGLLTTTEKLLGSFKGVKACKGHKDD